MLMRFFSRPIYPAALAAIIAFVVYQFTLAPSVDFIDAGELTTVCSTLGIAHPTGYPLFTLIGWVFAHLPIASSVIVRLNIMASFFTALGAGTLVLLASELFQFWMPERRKKIQQPARKDQRQPGKHNRDNGGRRKEEGYSQTPLSSSPAPVSTPLSIYLPAALVSGLAAAFSATWWDQSTSIEVYPVHLFIIPIVLLFFLRMLRKEEGERPGANGRLFALALGLSFANHMTTVLIAPATLYMFFARYGFNRDAWRRISRLVLPFILGLALYIYLPVRSAQHPLMDWGHPTTIGAFLHHVTGGQYKVWMFSSVGSAAKQWAYFWHRVPIEYTIVGAILALAGIYGMFFSASIRRTHILIFTLLLFFGCLLYSINYDIHDIDSYFLLAYLAMALWIGAGVLTLIRMLATPQKAQLIAVAAILLAAIEIGANYSDVDESGNYMVEDYTKNILNNLPPNAIIFSTEWDFWASGAFYYQLVEGMRPDVLVVDKAMMRDRPWYYALLERRAPQVFARAKPELDIFMKYLSAFDRGDAVNGDVIADAYQHFTEALVERNQDRPIFITQEMVDERDDLFAPGMKPVPAGIAYRLLPKDSLLQSPPPTLQWRDAHYRRRNYYTDDSRLLQAIPLAVYGQRELQQGNIEAARKFFDDALMFKPDMSQSLEGFGDRDRSIGEASNEKFAQIEALRNKLPH
jgi:hypothetical protein